MGNMKKEQDLPQLGEGQDDRTDNNVGDDDESHQVMMSSSDCNPRRYDAESDNGHRGSSTGTKMTSPSSYYEGEESELLSSAYNDDQPPPQPAAAPLQTTPGDTTTTTTTTTTRTAASFSFPTTTNDDTGDNDNNGSSANDENANHNENNDDDDWNLLLQKIIAVRGDNNKNNSNAVDNMIKEEEEEEEITTKNGTRRMPSTSTTTTTNRSSVQLMQAAEGVIDQKGLIVSADSANLTNSSAAGAGAGDGVGGTSSSKNLATTTTTTTTTRISPPEEGGSADYKDHIINDYCASGGSFTSDIEQQQQSSTPGAFHVDGMSTTTSGSSSHYSSSGDDDDDDDDEHSNNNDHHQQQQDNTATTTITTTEEVLLTAVKVEDYHDVEMAAQLEEKIRNRILQEAVQPDHIEVVPIVGSTTSNNNNSNATRVSGEMMMNNPNGNGSSTNTATTAANTTNSCGDGDGSSSNEMRVHNSNSNNAFTTTDHDASDGATGMKKGQNKRGGFLVGKQQDRKKILFGGGGCVLIALVVLAAVVGGLFVKNKDDDFESSSSSTTTTEPQLPNPTTVTTVGKEDKNRTTMEIVRDRGYVRCGFYKATGFCSENEQTGELEGMSVDICRSISLALLGTPDNFEPVFVNGKVRFGALSNGTVDVLTEMTTHNMGRDVYDRNSNRGYTFSTPHIYSGLMFGGKAPFVRCADELDSLGGECKDLRICVTPGSTAQTNVERLLPGGTVVEGKDFHDVLEKYKQGACNVIAGVMLLFAPLVKQLGLEFEIGHQVLTREPMASVTRSDDAEWSNFVSFLIDGLYLAEANNISRSNAHELRPMMEDNPELASMMESVVSVYGNYGDLYDKYVENIVPRQGLNVLYSGNDNSENNNNNESSGLLYYRPLGDYEAKGPGPIPGTSLDSILRRGYLRCGVNPRPFRDSNNNGTKNETKFMWFDLDIEFCRALSASLFSGETTERLGNDNSSFVDENKGTLQLVRLSSGNKTQAYGVLARDEVDVVAGVRVTLEAGYFEPTTEQGFTFSSPYFYDNKKFADAFALMTRDGESDVQFSDFVYWVVMATFYAEDHGIGRSSYSNMPVVGVFGENLKQMLRSCVLGVGSYAEIYNRSMEPLVPRSGANFLNGRGVPGPQQYAIPYK